MHTWPLLVPLLLQLACSLKLPTTITPLWLTARLTSARISTLFASLDYSACLPELCAAIACQRLGLVDEYSALFRQEPERLEEVAAAFLGHRPASLQHAHRLFNHRVMDYTPGFDSGRRQDSLGPLLQLTFTDLLPTTNLLHAQVIYRVLYDALDYAIYLLTVSQDEGLLEPVLDVLVRAHMIAGWTLGGFVSLREKALRQLQYLAWGLEAAVGRDPAGSEVHGRLRALLCLVLQSLDADTAACCRQDGDRQLALRLLQAEDVLWRDEQPAKLTSVTAVRGFVEARAERCNTRLLYAAAFHWRLTPARIAGLLAGCGAGLVPDGFAPDLVEYLQQTAAARSTEQLVEGLLHGGEDLAAMHRRLARVFALPLGHWSHPAAVLAVLGRQRGFLLRWDEHEQAGLDGLPELDAVRQQVQDELAACTARLLRASACCQKGVARCLERIGEYTRLAVKLRLSLRPWLRALEAAVPRYGLKLDRPRFLEATLGRSMAGVLAGSACEHLDFT